MGCRQIGKGMNEVVEKIMDIYDRDEISRDVAKELIVTARKAVHCCDGDENDAINIIRMRRCGCCLKKRGRGEIFYSVNDVSQRLLEDNDIMNNCEEILASDGLCKECFDKVINNWLQSENAGEMERKFIEQCIGNSK